MPTSEAGQRHCVEGKRPIVTWLTFGVFTLDTDLGADSLDLVDLMMILEDKFNLKIEEEDAEKIQTVDDVITFIISNN